MDEIDRELVRVRKRYETAGRERDEAIVRASEAGKSYRQIAKLVGVNFQRVGQIVAKSRV